MLPYQEREERIADQRGRWQEAVRANRQFAMALLGQGMNEEAARFAERSHILERTVVLQRMRNNLRRPWALPIDVLRYLFSWFLAILAGYGYRPQRTLGWYLVTICGFTFAYLKATSGWIPFGLPHPSTFGPLTWYEALILSVSSFHGRGFFQPLQSLGDPIAALAAIEAVIGLLIEISFIATFTQRYFGK